MSTDLLREFGLPATMLLSFGGFLIWIGKFAITHFVESIKDATAERKEMTAKFTAVVENHITHNSQCLTESISQMKEMRRDHDEFSIQLAKVTQ